MGRPFPLRFELPSPAKCLRVERVDANDYYAEDPMTGINVFGTDMSGHWRLWLMANGDFTLGTFIQLLDNGKVNRVTWHEDGTETVLEIRDETI
ncbi:hypothetical protein LCGC14_2054980 [marine sediment metagenome]|uniref:Uncharacterized protein n=1 Tax=marine sediment metagenome TaxID=412755 RepID=A0A0F9HJW0_9ZZZZ